MHSRILFIFFCSVLTLVQNFPVQVLDYVNPATGSLELLEIYDDEDYSDFEHKQSKKSIFEPCLQSQNGDVRCFFEDETRKAKFEENLKFATLPYPGEIFAQQEYEPQYLEYEQTLSNIEYPIATEELPFLNPSSIELDQALKPLPNYGTYIHGLEQQEGAPIVDSNIYQNTPLNLRMARKTSSYEDFLAQLSHDAMMNNIIPTMPYLRNSGTSRYDVSDAAAPTQVVASFPNAAGAGGCAQPILFGCSPTIYQGRLAPWPLSIHPYSPTPNVKIALPYKGHVMANHKGHTDTTCPQGEIMGYNLQCVRRGRTRTTNQSFWENYDTPVERQVKS